MKKSSGKEQKRKKQTILCSIFILSEAIAAAVTLALLMEFPNGVSFTFNKII